MTGLGVSPSTSNTTPAMAKYSSEYRLLQKNEAVPIPVSKAFKDRNQGKKQKDHHGKLRNSSFGSVVHGRTS